MNDESSHIGSLLDNRLIVLQAKYGPTVIDVSICALGIVLQAVWEEMLGQLDQTMRLLLRVFYFWYTES